MQPQLEGKAAVITGGGSGVGRASCLRFAEEGARVVCVDIDLDRAKETVALVDAAGGVAVAEVCDVSVEDDVVSAIATTVERFGQLDIMFNNVGVPTPRLGAKLEDHTVEDFEHLVGINFRGVFLGSKHAVVQFKHQKSRWGDLEHRLGGGSGRLGWLCLRGDQGGDSPAHPGRGH